MCDDNMVVASKVWILRTAAENPMETALILQHLILLREALEPTGPRPPARIQHQHPMRLLTTHCIGTLTTWSDSYTTLLIPCLLFPALADLVNHPLGKDTCWVLANIVVENVNHIDVVVSDSRALPTFIRLLKVDISKAVAPTRPL